MTVRLYWSAPAFTSNRVYPSAGSYFRFYFAFTRNARPYRVNLFASPSVGNKVHLDVTRAIPSTYQPNAGS